MTLEFIQNPVFRRFEKRLLELHELMASGKDDDATADALREEMTSDYRSLTSKEVDFLQGLSEDLYSLTEVKTPTTKEDSTTEAELAKQLMIARQRENWTAVLHYLRPLAHRFPSEALAFQRYQAYLRLGLIESAYLFLRHSSELDPMNLRKKHILLDVLVKAGHTTEAVAKSEQLLQDSETPAPLVVAAAHIRYEALRNVPADSASPIVSQIKTALERALRDTDAFKGMPPSVLIVGYTTLGFCLDALDDLQGALSAFSEAIKLDPESDALRVALGLVLLPHDLSRAAEEFMKAAELKSHLFHPYLFLAPYALGQGKWAEAKAHAQRLLQYARDPAIEAQAWHWTAIAEYQLGADPAKVNSLFERAIQLDLLNPQISENFGRLKQVEAGATPRSDIPWSRPTPNDFPRVSTFRDAPMMAVA